MSERGVFAMDRGWFDHPTFAAEPYTEREAWAWLIAEAAFKPHRRRIGKYVLDLERGQLAASVRFLADKWSWHASKVQRYLSKLRVHDMIETAAGQGITTITICNYAKYQRVSLPDETQIDTVAIQQRYKEEYLEFKEEEGEGGGDAREADKKLVPDAAVALADEIAVIAGHDLKFVPPKWCGAAMYVAKWLREGWSRDVILIGVRTAMANKRDGPPSKITYFEKPIAREVARQSAPLPLVKIPQGEVIHEAPNANARYGGDGGDRRKPITLAGLAMVRAREAGLA